MQNARPRKLLLYATMAAALVAAFVAGWVLMAPTPEPEQAILLPEPKPLPDFELLDQDGNAWTRQSLQDQWHVLFFGFTHCPDVCPITLSTLARAMQRLDEQGRQRPQVVFVTVDPARDGIAEVGNYAGHFAPGFIGVTGELAEIDLFARAAAIGVRRHQPDADGHYMVDHSSSLVIIDPRGHIAGYITPPLEAGTIARDLNLIMNRRLR